MSQRLELRHLDARMPAAISCKYGIDYTLTTCYGYLRQFKTVYRRKVSIFGSISAQLTDSMSLKRPLLATTA